MCVLKSQQVTKKVPKWSKSEAPSDGFILISVDTDLCWISEESTHLVNTLFCDHQNTRFVDANKGPEKVLKPTSRPQLRQEVQTVVFSEVSLRFLFKTRPLKETDIHMKF